MNPHETECENPQFCTNGVMPCKPRTRGRGRPQLSDDERGHQITIYMSADNFRWYESLTKMTRAKHINRALQEYRATRESPE